MTISVVISTRNRSTSLERTLESVKSIADEVIVVDNESSDDTSAVAKKFKAIVFSRKNSVMLNSNKNFGFSKAKGSWILSLDDDEVITEHLAKEIIQAIHADSYDGYWIPRKNIIFGKWIRHGIWWPDRQLRLFKKGKGLFPEKHVHEYVEVNGPTGTLNEPYVHYNYDSLHQYLAKMQDIYTESEVQKYVASGYRVNWKDAIRFPVSDFLKLYFAEHGYRDGLHGLVLSGLQSFYSFLIFVKLWEREKFPQQEPTFTEIIGELSAVRRETTYWEITSKIEHSKNPILSIWLKLIRRMFR